MPIRFVKCSKNCCFYENYPCDQMFFCMKPIFCVKYFMFLFVLITVLTRLSVICGNKMPTGCNRDFYCRSYCLINKLIKVVRRYLRNGTLFVESCEKVFKKQDTFVESCEKVLKKQDTFIESCEKVLKKQDTFVESCEKVFKKYELMVESCKELLKKQESLCRNLREST